MEVFPLHSLIYTAFHFWKSSIAVRSWHLPELPLWGRVDFCLNIGALLLEITCPKCTKTLGKVEKAWTVEPEDLCLDYVCHLVCHLSLWTWTGQVIYFLTWTQGCWEDEYKSIMDSAFWVVKSLEVFIILSGRGNECLLWWTNAGLEALIPTLLYTLLHDLIVSAKGLLIYKPDETT